MIHISLLSPWKTVKWKQRMGFLPDDGPGSNLFFVHGFTGILKLPLPPPTKCQRAPSWGPRGRGSVRGGGRNVTQLLLWPRVGLWGGTLLMWPYCVRDILMRPCDRLESHHCQMTFISIVSLVFLMPKETHAQLEKNSNLQKYIMWK